MGFCGPKALRQIEVRGKLETEGRAQAVEQRSGESEVSFVQVRFSNNPLLSYTYMDAPPTGRWRIVLPPSPERLPLPSTTGQAANLTDAGLLLLVGFSVLLLTGIANSKET